MKKKIHPDYHKIKVVMTDGTEFETKSICKVREMMRKLDRILSHILLVKVHKKF